MKPQPVKEIKVFQSDGIKREIKFIAISEEVAQRAAGGCGWLLSDGRVGADFRFTLYVSKLYKYGDVWRYLREWG